MEKKRFAIWPRCRCLPTLPSSTASSPDRIYLAATGTRTSTRTPYDTARWTSRNHAGRDLVTPPSLPRGIYICATVKNWLRSNAIPKMGFALMPLLRCGRSLECHFSPFVAIAKHFSSKYFFSWAFFIKIFFSRTVLPLDQINISTSIVLSSVPGVKTQIEERKNRWRRRRRPAGAPPHPLASAPPSSPTSAAALLPHLAGAASPTAPPLLSTTQWTPPPWKALSLILPIDLLDMLCSSRRKVRFFCSDRFAVDLVLFYLCFAFLLVSLFCWIDLVSDDVNLYFRSSEVGNVEELSGDLNWGFPSI